MSVAVTAPHHLESYIMIREISHNKIKSHHITIEIELFIIIVIPLSFFTIHFDVRSGHEQ